MKKIPEGGAGVAGGGAGGGVLSIRGAPPPLYGQVAVCLLTADRTDYTCRTVQSFSEIHDGIEDGRMIGLHYDDGSAGYINLMLAEAYGYDNVGCPLTRQGQIAGLRALVEAAHDHECPWVLYLENDWLWQRQVPFNVLDHGGADCVRLYGPYKEQGGGPRAPTGPRLMGTKTLIQWSDIPAFPGYQSGKAHWAGPPSITKTALLLPAVRRARTMGEIYRSLHLQTIRPLENMVWHIGQEPTPDPKP